MGGGLRFAGHKVTGADGLVLTTAASVHELPAAMAPGARVHLRGTVSYYDPYDTVMFLAG